MTARVRKISSSIAGTATWSTPSTRWQRRSWITSAQHRATPRCARRPCAGSRITKPARSCVASCRTLAFCRRTTRLPCLTRPLRHEMSHVGMITALRELSQQERINFLLTNRVPRKALTHLVGWWSRIESPLLTRASIAVWRLFTDLDLSDAESQHFTSLRACFTRQLIPGARTVDPRPDVVTSPCDAIVGECGDIAGTTVFQAKGFPYELEDLIPEPRLRRDFKNGRYVTLRLKSNMYHRFHAPA